MDRSAGAVTGVVPGLHGRLLGFDADLAVRRAARACPAQGQARWPRPHGPLSKRRRSRPCLRWVPQQKSRPLTQSPGRRWKSPPGGTSRPALNDRVVRRRYQFIDQSRRRFAIAKVRLYGGDGNFCEHEGGAPELRRTSSTECTACKARHAALEPLCLIAHATFEGFGPIALHEIMTAIEQQ